MSDGTYRTLYIYAVTNKLPTNQRADIEKELRGLIEDMLEEQLQGREATDEDVQQVLAELGDPREMANRYRDAKQYLIGPELFSSYLSVLKIVIIAVSIAFAVLFCIESLLEPRTIAELFIDHLLGLIIAYFQAFTWVTIIFALIEFYTIRKGRSHKLSGSGAWKPSDLPQLPDHLTEIKRSGPIASIIFYTSPLGSSCCLSNISGYGGFKVSNLRSSRYSMKRYFVPSYRSSWLSSPLPSSRISRC